MNPPRILLVDDNALNVELASYLLLARGFVIDTAVDAIGALRSVRARPPDLILMDIQLPGIDGLTLTRQLKADASTRDIVIVAFTAFAMKGDEQKMRVAGCDGYISKPIDVGSFAATVQAHLNARPPMP